MANVSISNLKRVDIREFLATVYRHRNKPSFQEESSFTMLSPSKRIGEWRRLNYGWATTTYSVAVGRGRFAVAQIEIGQPSERKDSHEIITQPAPETRYFVRDEG